MPSVQPSWCVELPLQQQSVLLLAARGPDGIPKAHPTKDVVRAYRGTVLVAARFNRELRFGERADSFMCLEHFGNDEWWEADVKQFFKHCDQLPHHYYMHLMHGSEILGYKHPDVRFRARWCRLYLDICHDLHLTAETEDQMDLRLSDWGRDRRNISAWMRRRGSVVRAAP
jgi:hypothetical protein